ncbi:MAG TPA: DUF4097 family beta strand repeat-containing protein [Gemmatimonadaceae bacterium]|nr:DUF4097 family beta strand repeat-containing protein [Gemmatimonadaceae bacterium]
MNDRRQLIGLLTAVCAVVLGIPTSASAQATDDRQADSTGQAWLERCRDNDRDWGDGERYCEVRVSRMPAGKSLDVDGQQNGSVHVYGWDRDEVRVVAKIQTNAQDADAAKELASGITVQASGGRVRADGPSMRRRESWSVSYDVWTPRRTDVTATAHNGGLAVEDVDGRMDLSTQNGSIALRRIAGDVRGETTNGSVTAVLDGDRWNGDGLDLRTTNGSVNLSIPDRYSARLETGTTNGGMRIDFPVTVQGTIGRHLTTQLGSGGPPIRAVTVNGAVSIRRR